MNYRDYDIEENKKITFIDEKVEELSFVVFKPAKSLKSWIIMLGAFLGMFICVAPIIYIYGVELILSNILTSMLVGSLGLLLSLSSSSLILLLIDKDNFYDNYYIELRTFDSLDVAKAFVDYHKEHGDDEEDDE